MAFDLATIAAEQKWLQDHPWFDQKPASVLDFLGPGYLDIDKKVRPGLKVALAEIFGKEVNGDRIANFEEAMVTGAIGIGKTTFASIALPYMCHWVLCLRDPQDFFNLLPGSRIAFMQMSTSETQALQVIFGDIKARVQHSRWFLDNALMDPKYTKQIRFPGKDIWILPGDSAETTFEGYNILAGILDEMDSHKQTKDKDYADVGFDTIQSRIASRFIDEDNDGHKGLLMCIGQMKKASGFAARKYRDMQKNPKAHVTRMTIWESFGWQKFLNPDGTRNAFWYDIKRKIIVPDGVVAMVDNKDFIQIPNAYRAQFENNPEKALRDLAGIPPATADPFISLVDKIESCETRWHDEHGTDSPVGPGPHRWDGQFAPWFKANGDPRRRAAHIDIAVSGDGDALGFAMGHIKRVVEIDDEFKPHIVIDCLVRLKAGSGQEIMLSDVRKLIYYLKDDLRFRLLTVTMDGFQSTDTMQQLKKRKYRADYLSVDKNTLPYEDLREAIYEERLDFPRYMTYRRKGDTVLEDIAMSELMQLTDTGKKIDHPTDGSKDLADALAGVVSTLMGDRTYRKGVPRDRSLTDDDHDEDEATEWSPVSMDQPVNTGSLTSTLMGGLSTSMPSTNYHGLGVPDRLRAR